MNQAISSLSGIPTALVDLAISPVKRWQAASPIHKLIALGSGAAAAYYLHQKGMTDAAVAAAALGAAYSTSMVMHYPAMHHEKHNGVQAMMKNKLIPQTQIDSMKNNASRVLGSIIGQETPGASLPQSNEPASSIGLNPKPAEPAPPPRPARPGVTVEGAPSPWKDLE